MLGDNSVQDVMERIAVALEEIAEQGRPQDDVTAELSSRIAYVDSRFHMPGDGHPDTGWRQRDRVITEDSSRIDAGPRIVEERRDDDGSIFTYKCGIACDPNHTMRWPGCHMV